MNIETTNRKNVDTTIGGDSHGGNCSDGPEISSRFNFDDNTLADLRSLKSTETGAAHFRTTEAHNGDSDLWSRDGEAARRILGGDTTERSELPNINLTDSAAVTEGRQKIQQFSQRFVENFEKIDTLKDGTVSKEDLESYLQNPDLSKEDRDMATFFSKNYDFIKGIDKYPLHAGNSEYKGEGLYRTDAERMEALTDPDKLRGLVKKQSFSGFAAALGFGAGTFAGTLVAANLTANVATATGAGYLALLGGATVFALGTGVAVGLAVGVGAGYFLYQRQVREHYSEKRKALETIMRQ